MSEADIYELDRELVRALAGIHPANLPQLRLRLLAVLAGTMGIEPRHEAFAPLSLIRTIDELARVDWEAMSARIACLTRLPECARASIIAHVRLFAERSILLVCLHWSRSASTLWLQGETWSIPRRGWPSELSARYGEFSQVCNEADAALEQGRVSLQAFNRSLMTERTLSKPQALLKRANACYARYLQALHEADQVAESISWYLAAVQEPEADEKETPQGRRAAA